MKVLILGGTGFTGSATVRNLLDHGHEVRCLVRKDNPNLKYIPATQTEVIVGDIHDETSISSAAKSCDAVINLVPTAWGYVPKLVQGLQATNAKRLISLCTTSIFTSINAPTKKRYIEAEKTIEASKLQYTILRPTMIYGNQRDRNMSRLIH